MNKASKLLREICDALVENKEAVRIDTSTDEMGVLLVLHLAPEDMGKIIGKGGETAKAIRYILRLAGITEKARINLKIEEPVGGKRYNSYEGGYSKNDQNDNPVKYSV